MQEQPLLANVSAYPAGLALFEGVDKPRKAPQFAESFGVSAQVCFEVLRSFQGGFRKVPEGSGGFRGLLGIPPGLIFSVTS